MPFRMVLLLVCLCSVSTIRVHAENSLPPMLNQLRNSPSPYLAAHGADPVLWQEWNATTLQRARRENKLLFVSIGYFSCHWCHVMQAESYRNPEIAALINQYFIPVKVDRELEVALDAEMIAYAQGRLGAAGWPLNVFITPDGYPLYAILYQPPDRFRQMLQILAQEWGKDSDALKAIAKQSVVPPAPVKRIPPDSAQAQAARVQLVKEALAQADMLGGGIDVPRKFPLAPQLAALLEIEARQHGAELGVWLQLTLNQMMQGGLHDHLAGGFFRYTIDPGWQRPHFEKMLYDNAQLAVIYLRAAQIFRQPAYREIALQTLDFMLEQMREGNGFITSLSALNDAGTEGGAYLWSKQQLQEILDDSEYRLVEKIWKLDVPPEFDAGYLPMNRVQPDAAEQARLQQIYRKLMQVRARRGLPRDNKLLAGLNGLALAAFSEAADIAPKYRQAADSLRDLFVNQLWQNGKLLKGISQGRSLGDADLEGYAYSAWGLLRYAQMSGRDAEMLLARHIAQAAWADFYTPYGFLLEQRSVLAKPFYQRVIEDGPLPSPGSVLIETSIASGDTALRAQARDALSFAEGLQANGMFWNASRVTALSRMFPEKYKGKKMPLNQRGRSGAKVLPTG